jgi:hypothetical protein
VPVLVERGPVLVERGPVLVERGQSSRLNVKRLEPYTLQLATVFVSVFLLAVTLCALRAMPFTVNAFRFFSFTTLNPEP